MLIGQAPGHREIETGLPFAHDAGRRLVGWLSTAGISVEDFRGRWYVTSVAKCYPGRKPGSAADAPPSRAEVQRWSPYLDDEVRLVAPQIVVLVGALAHRYAFGAQARADALVGRALTWERVPQASVLALPHPSGASTWLVDPAHVPLWHRSLDLLADAWREVAS